MVRLEDIVIDPEFRDLLPVVTDDRLASKIESEGWDDTPIVVWMHHNILVDGHRRLAIWQDQKARGVDVGDPQVKEMPFKSKSEALIWMSIHQESRRNLSESQKAMLATKLVPHYAEMARERQKAAGEHGKEGGRGNKKPLSPTGAKGLDAKRASKEAAKAVGVGARTVEKAQAVRKHGSDELIKAVEAGEVSVSRADTIARTVPKEDQLEEAKAVLESKTRKTKEEAPTQNKKPEHEATDRQHEIAQSAVADFTNMASRSKLVKLSVKNPSRDYAFDEAIQWLKYQKKNPTWQNRQSSE